MEQRKFLVTGATGRTSAQTIRHLLADGHAVRAFVHSEDAHSEALRRQGAEVVVGDLLEHNDVIRALEGVTGAYLCYPVRPGFIQVTAYFADAAREDSKSHGRAITGSRNACWTGRACRPCISGQPSSPNGRPCTM